MNITLEDLLAKIRNYNPDGTNIVKKAYEFASLKHSGQTRQSGEPYITHPLNVAYILADMYADTDTVCAGLLHDTLEDTNTKKEELAELFNKDIANLVDGVTKLAKMNFSSKEEQNLANTRKIITSITSDVRIIIVKLADRLHNMRTLYVLSEAKQKRKAKETLEILTPVAHRLGMYKLKSEFKQKENALETMDIFVPLAYYIGAYRIKSELEDLSLQYLEPNMYKKIAEQKNIVEEDSKPCVNEMLYEIEQ